MRSCFSTRNGLNFERAHVWLCYEVQTEDIYKDMKADADWFDFSNYPKDHSNFSLENKKVLGKMKDETAGEPILQFAGLRPKMYSLITKEDEMKRAKGVKKYVVKKHLRHKDYVTVLDKGTLMRNQMNMFRSTDHDVHTISAVKISLSAFDNKRYISV